jgi:glycosyltransferase involved in cell wall biosynthesis
MRIGVDGACWANRRGYGRYAREIMGAMVRAAPEAEFVCFVDEAAEQAFRPEGANVRLVRVAQSRPPTLAASADGARSPADLLRFSRAVWREPLDVFFSPSVYTYFPLPPSLPAVVTIHDAIAERFPELTLPSRRARLFWRAKVGLAVHQARLVLTVSDFAGREIAAVHGIRVDRIRVAVEAPAEAYRPDEDPERVAEAAVRAGVPAGAPWFVYVGGFNPHKNVDLLVRAHARVSAAVTEGGDGRAPHLLLVGMTEGDAFHGSLQAIRRAIDEEGTSELVHWPGYLSDEELRSLLTGALALALPSECEGFGLPAVEAAACGCPVVATLESPLPELLEGGGIFVRPGDVDALTAGLLLLATDPDARRAYGLRALERARALSWPRAAADALSALREAAA